MTVSDEVENIERLSIDELTEFQGSLKKLPEKNLQKLINSILTVGFTAPFFAFKNDGKNYLLDGHQRLKALMLMRDRGDEIPELPVVFIKAESKAEAKRKLLFIVSQYGKPDQKGFEDFVSDLDYDLSDIEIPDIDLDFLYKTETQGDDDTPALEENAVSQFGEIYELGNSLLMCGDSTDPETYTRLFGGGVMADMVFTDPPYGMFLDTDYSECLGSLGKKNNTRGNKYNKVIGDNEDFKPELITSIFDNFGYCKEIFLFGADYYAELLTNKNNGSWLVWDKRKESQSEAIGSEFELIWSKNKHKRRMLRHDWFGFLSSGNVKEARNRVHPTQKPTSLIIDVIEQWGKGVNIIVDMYGGSGSTLIACEKTDRKCRMIELDPHYCDVIRRRWTKWAKENNRPIGSGGLE